MDFFSPKLKNNGATGQIKVKQRQNKILTVISLIKSTKKEDFKKFFRYFMKKLLKVFEDIESRTKTKNHFSRTNKNFVTKKLVRNFFFRLSKISTTPPVCLTSGGGGGPLGDQPAPF